jgi:hypothetical protein
MNDDEKKRQKIISTQQQQATVEIFIFPGIMLENKGIFDCFMSNKKRKTSSNSLKDACLIK